MPEQSDVDDGFDFDIEQDSLADSFGRRIPRRAIAAFTGKVGAGKSVLTGRLVYGLLENGHKIVVVTTELTTRGWLEHMNSLGYPVSDKWDSGQFIVLSRYGVVAEHEHGIGIEEVLESSVMEDAEFVVVDSASTLLPTLFSQHELESFLQNIRRFASLDRTLLLTLDPDEMDGQLLQRLRAMSELAIDLETSFLGGELVRRIVVTRFLRACGPVQSTLGWRVEPGMGFIVDITAVS